MINDSSDDDRRVTREIRAGLFRSPVVVLHDRASLSKLSTSKLRVLVNAGVISEQRIEALPSTATALPPTPLKTRATAPAGGGDYVSGLASNYMLRLSAVFPIVPTYVSTPVISGIHTLTDVAFYAPKTASAGASSIMFLDLRYGPEPASNATEFAALTSVFDDLSVSGNVNVPAAPIILSWPQNLNETKIHLDKLVNSSLCVYTLCMLDRLDSYDSLSCLISVRAADSFRPTLKSVKAPSAIQHLTRPPSAVAVASTSHVSGTQQVNVVKSPSATYEAFLYDRSYIVAENDLGAFSSAFQPVQIVPVNEGQITFSRLFSGGRLTPYMSGYKRGLEYTAVKYKLEPYVKPLVQEPRKKTAKALTGFEQPDTMISS